MYDIKPDFCNLIKKSPVDILEEMKVNFEEKGADNKIIVAVIGEIKKELCLRV